ncbi:MAG TPA: hypothetical protein VEG24_09005 [Gaiellaceae bacterium]|nr:hypothetical protein [Gaiellaceae bacterium]
MAELGPVEMMVVEFDGYRFKGEIWPELERLKENDVIRLIDLLVLRKDRSGALAVLTATDLGMKEMLEFGAKIGTLMGAGKEGDEGYAQGVLAGLQKVSTGHIFDEAEAQKLAEDIPLGTAVAVALVEHRWAIPLRGAIARADGEILSDEWLSAEHLMELGRIAGSTDQPGLDSGGNGHKSNGN